MNLLTLSIFNSDRPAEHPWRKLCGRAVILLVVFLIANVFTFRTSGYFEKLREYHKGVDGIFMHPEVRTLVAGDSHFASPLNSYLNPSHDIAAYSIAFGGDGLRECFAKVRYVLDRCSTIDTLIVSADPHMFGRGRLESSNRSFADVYFLSAADGSGLKKGWLSTLLGQVPLFNDDFVQYLRKVSMKRLMTAFSAERFGSANAARSGSAGKARQSWDHLSDAERKAEAYATGLMDHKGVCDYTEPFIWYRKLLELARAHNVRVIGVRLPVDPEYASQVPPERVAAIDHFLRQNGIAKILDLRNLFTDPEYFDDSDHVKKKYAAALISVIEKRSGIQLYSYRQ